MEKTLLNTAWQQNGGAGGCLHDFCMALGSEANSACFIQGMHWYFDAVNAHGTRAHSCTLKSKYY